MTVKVKHSLTEFLGKTVSGIIVAEYPEGNPVNRIFFIFSDGSGLETWQDFETIYMSSAPDFRSVDRAVDILERRDGARLQIFRSPYEDPNEPQRDLLGYEY